MRQDAKDNEGAAEPDTEANAERRKSVKERATREWQKLRIASEEYATDFDQCWLQTRKGKDGKHHPVLAAERGDDSEVRANLDEIGGTGTMGTIVSDDAGDREYAIARGYAALVMIEQATTDSEETTRTLLMGRSLDTPKASYEATIHVPATLRQRRVTSVVFGRALETHVVAGSNEGALLMAAARAAGELVSHPHRTVRSDAARNKMPPVHPDLGNEERIIGDPVRNTPDEPWRWGPASVEDYDSRKTTMVWHDANTEMSGWYVITRDSDGRAVEITGPIHDDAQAVCSTLADIFPAARGRYNRPAAMQNAANTARGALERHSSRGTDDADLRRARMLEELEEIGGKATGG